MSDRDELTVLPGEEAVRRRIHMYFGVGRGDPRLPTMVFGEVVKQAFHPGRDSAAAHVSRVVAEITADLVFTVTDDQADTLPPGHDLPLFTGHPLMDRRLRRGVYLDASTICTHVDVEVWRDGRGFRLTLDGYRPIAPPEPFTAPAGAGTRATFFLDEAFTGRAAITLDPMLLDLHYPDCGERPDGVVLRDLRG
ncbi:DNA gyrase/topoisomerase IV subunit B [Catenuloplanes nepalensis]|uniref:DNA gyrase/topoisomerase IV subunit B n=1 Tax=Catenuloplanes nepalensis TaxID=587533 RepID=A0ABT9MUM5_9ACTN|nr:hypothetical protein [Catenuloplanes nepalensis]MDP9795147.1 DNA gyrase/topoisomerase IV subunit B [Catenuloplanes nepalensis]